MRILLRGPDGHLHLMWKALANGRVFLLLAAGLTVTRARRKRTGAPCWQQELHCRCRGAGHVGPQASGRVHVPE